MNASTKNLIINALREASIKSDGRRDCLKLARTAKFVRHSKRGTPILKLFWRCAKCGEWFRDEKSMEVDHIIEIGSFTGCWDDYIEKLFCGQDNLQCLCIGCHKKKTSFNARLRLARKISYHDL